MLDESALRQLYQNLKLSKQAQQVIEEIRSSPPTRRVSNTAGNVSVRYPSRKMGVIIQAESHRNELAGIYEKEYDPETLEYYDQPPRIKLIYLAKSERRVGVLHTPDFFVIRRDSVGWEEWKTEADLPNLVEKMPHRYVRDGSVWRCPPGEKHAEQFGFFYKVRSSAEIDWILQRNLLFLEDYLQPSDVTEVEAPTKAILASVKKQPGITLQDLIAESNEAVDLVFTLVAQGRVYVDLHAVPLVEAQRVNVFQDQETARAYTVMANLTTSVKQRTSPFVTITPGTTVVWDERRWVIVNLGATEATLLAEDSTVIELPNATLENLIKTGRLVNPTGRKFLETHPIVSELLALASPADFEKANRHYSIIAPRLAGDSIDDENTSPRTVRDWLNKWRKAETSYGCGYVGLLSQHQEQGNRQRKLPDSTLDMLQTFILNDYETLKQKTKLAVYGALLRKCEEQGIEVPSYKTFIQAVAQRPRTEQVQKRQGKRAAYQLETFYHELSLTTPRHGDRPFEIGHIDHTLLDIELVCSKTGRNLGRPWGTFLSDAFSRRLLAVSLSFDAPSYRACMMILRECVQRNGRLPQIVVVDGGREFESTYFETLLARYECTKKTRPGAQPRFGSVCERLFGTTNTRFIYNLLGNTQITRNVRQVTKSVAPQEQACWALGEFYARLCEWAYDIYDTIEHPALSQSPRDAFMQGMLQGGQRLQRVIPYDETFRTLTLPTTRKGTAKVMPRMGVKVNYLYYWADAFLNPEVEKTWIPVRYDPFDSGIAYGFVNGRWVKCHSEHYACFVGRSEREVQLATVELRKRHQLYGQQFTVTARKLADFITSLEAEELLLEQRLRDSEARKILASPSADKIANTSLENLPEELSLASSNQELVSDKNLNSYGDY